MELAKIKDLIGEYKQSLVDRDSKRKQWKAETKQLILNTLGQIQKTFAELDWGVQDVDAGDNWETVNIIFHKTHSGMMEEDKTGTKALIKFEGYLAFSQTYNGDIVVFIVYPYVEEHLSRMHNKVVEKISPFSVNENYIVNKVGTFLNEMINWEKGIFTSNNEKVPIEPIGFRLPFAYKEE